MNYGLKGHIRWMGKIGKGFGSRIFRYVLAETASVCLSLLFVYYSKRAIDIVTGAGRGPLIPVLAEIAACMVSGVAFSLFASWLNRLIEIKMTVSLQNSLVKSQMAAEWSLAGRWHTGDLQVRIDEDCRQVVQMLSTSLPYACVTVFKLAASVVFLWIMDPLLAVMIVAVSPLFLFSKIYYKKMRKLNKSVKNAESRMGIVLQENLKSRLTIRALGISKGRWDMFSGSQDSIVRLKKEQLKFTTFTQGIVGFTFNGSYLLAFLWGIYRMHLGLITFGTMTAFLQLVGRVQAPVQNLISFVPDLIRSRNSADRLMELYEGKREKGSGEMRLSPPLRLRLENVSYGYGEQAVIRNLEAGMATGTSTAVVGPTGEGKTTLIRLMLGLLEPWEGNLKIETEGESFKISPATRCNFSYVPQGNTLFKGTIRENLLYSAPDASEIQLRKALETACADFVFALPKGIDEQIGESGASLSEGQAQRIAVARALLHEGEIWLFDEATSALDRKTSERMVSNIMKAGKDKIVVFITHDRNLAAACTQTVYLNGKNYGD